MVMSVLQAFSSAVFCICDASRGPSASAELLVLLVELIVTNDFILHCSHHRVTS